MLGEDWPRCAGVSLTDIGEVAAVWLAFERATDSVHAYDCAIFRREVLAVIVEGLNARGRWIPIAWSKGAEAFVGDLLKRGCNTMHDPSDDSDAMAEIVSRTIWERMRTGRFRVDKRLGEWLDEFKGFQRVDGKVPRTGFPLMAATRHALQSLSAARAPASATRSKLNYPKQCIV